jgi:hypothetical protein
MSQNPSGTTVESSNRRLWKPILIAGLLGGLLGSSASVVASRFLKPAPVPPPPVPNQDAINEAREVVNSLLTELKDGRTERFMAHIRPAYQQMTDDQFKQFKKDFVNARLEYPRYLGNPLGQFEVIRESADGPNLVRLTYMEKYEHSALIWRFILYRGSESWNLAYLKFDRIPVDAITNN